MVRYYWRLSHQDQLLATKWPGVILSTEYVWSAVTSSWGIKTSENIRRGAAEPTAWLREVHAAKDIRLAGDPVRVILPAEDIGFACDSVGVIKATKNIRLAGNSIRIVVPAENIRFGCNDATALGLSEGAYKHNWHSSYQGANHNYLQFHGIAGQSYPTLPTTKAEQVD